MKNKLTTEEKEAIVASAFKDAPEEEMLFVSNSGTVLTKKEYDARPDKQGCDTFTNPTNKKEVAAEEVEEEEVKAEEAPKKKSNKPKS